MSGLQPYDGTDAFDVVVIGSGFGGSVAAAKFAEAGQSVLVLERGRAYPPGTFPRTPHEMGSNFWDPSKGYYGLFNIWSFQRIDAVVASGLGGGSLIYANVLLRKDPAWFRQPRPDDPSQDEDWPITYGDLEPHYANVEAVLQPELLPFGEGFRHGESARTSATLDAPFYGSFYDESRRTCRLCGECDVGCNDGSKNTLDHTYLALAHHHGAVISPLSQAVGLVRSGEGFGVDYVVHRPSALGQGAPTASLPRQRVRARRVVLGAGALGSSYFLLQHGPGLGVTSKALGTRYCGNGDLLGFVLRAKQIVDGERGPVITSRLRHPDAVDAGGAGYGSYVEDAGYPGFAGWLVEHGRLYPIVKRTLRFAALRLWERIRRQSNTDLSGELAELLGGGALSSRSMPLLGMGRDVPDGRLFLESDVLQCDWNFDSSAAYYDQLGKEMAAIAEQLGGRFQRNPTWWLKRLVTVHSLGGLPMGRTADVGVVDPVRGEVFGVPGLHVLDGAVMPGPVGPNPSLTIAAFADRACTKILEAA
jgi:cholesterol oxidase